MIDILYNSNIAFIGGGSICKEILETILGRYFNDLNLTVIGVADTNNKAKGLTYAKKKGLFTTKDYKELLKIKGIDLIIELTGDYNVLNELKVSKPSQAKLIDHIEAMSIQHFLQIEEKIIKIKRNLIKQYNDHEKIEKEFEPFSNELINIIKNKVQDIQAIEKDLKERTKNVQLLEKDLIEKVKAIYEEEREKYNILFETDPNPIFIIDSQTYKILDVNKRAQDCYEYSKEELLQKSFLELGDEKEEEFVAKLKALNEDQCVFFSKKRHYRKDHHQFYVNINVCHSSYHENHEDNAFIVTTTDISESTEKEIQLIQTSKMTTLGTMAAGIAHELNQPLNVIQIGADFFLKKIRKEEPIENKDLYTIASEINTNVQRAAEIINQLRNFARQSEVVGDKVDINAPIRDVCKLVRQQLRVHQIEIKLDLDNNLSRIIADHNRLVQVFMNLVINSMDAMDELEEKNGSNPLEKQLIIKTYSEEDHIIATISDTGIGIPEEIRDKIFEPFFTTKDVGKGTGLGMSITYAIIKDYDGTIGVKSKENKGTTFELRFPSCS